MPRTTWITAATLVVACALAGCGGEDPATGVVSLTAQARGLVPVASAVPATAGRLGPATTASGDGRLVLLSPGGAPDVRPGGDAAPREGVGAASACPAPELEPVAATLPAVLDATVCLVNAARTDRGLVRLTANPRLAEAARRYAADLVAGQYFSHTGRDGSELGQRLKRVGYIPADRAWVVGENLAWGTGPLATPVAVMRAWMNSPGHRENVLNPRFREIGLGIALGNPAGAEGGGATYASEFGAVAAPNRRRLRGKRAARALLRARR